MNYKHFIKAEQAIEALADILEIPEYEVVDILRSGMEHKYTNGRLPLADEAFLAEMDATFYRSNDLRD